MSALAALVQDLEPLLQQPGWSTTVSSGGDRIYVTWHDGEKQAGQVKIDVLGRTVHFISFRMEEGYDQLGAYRRLCERLPGYFKPQGVRRFTTTTDSPQALEAMRRYGDWRPVEGERGVTHEWVL